MHARSLQQYWLVPDTTYLLQLSQERADTSGQWKEFTAPDGRKYYYNKVTKESRWTMPEEMKGALQYNDCFTVAFRGACNFCKHRWPFLRIQHCGVILVSWISK